MDRRVSRREFLRAAALAAAAPALAPVLRRRSMDRPNIVVILTDDLGYGDLGCYGAEPSDTPFLDRLAAEGTRFTDFYAPHASCSPSRAGLLTGCYPYRVSVPEVLDPSSPEGLNPEEETLPKLLRSVGYRTACVGKWHLGHRHPCLPTDHGFDEFFGLPYSNDMWRLHPNPGYARQMPPLRLMEGDRPADRPPGGTRIDWRSEWPEVGSLRAQDDLTRLYTARALEFVRGALAARRPFFLYLAHSMPHVPLGASSRFRGTSPRGLYGDVLRELDDSVRQIVEALGDQARNTLLAFTSDNGPWLSYGDHAGATAGLREGKGTTFDGGQRVPMVVWSPGRVPAGRVCREPTVGIDLLPTLAELAGAPLPKKRIDGRSELDLWLGKDGARTPHEAIFFHYASSGAIEAVRSGRWKLHLPHPYRTLAGKPGSGGQPGPYREDRIGLELFDLEADPFENRDVSGEHRDVVDRLLELAVRHTEEIHANRRPAARMAD
ncbi:MAG: sulfatase [Fimbriimonadaceae bacterium]